MPNLLNGIDFCLPTYLLLPPLLCVQNPTPVAPVSSDPNGSFVAPPSAFSSSSLVIEKYTPKSYQDVGQACMG